MITPYTESQWQADRQTLGAGGRLACPDCGHSRNFAPLARHGPGLLEIHYRGCKVCGFWQIADGQSAPYRCRMSVHLCLGEFDTQRECRGCGSGMPAGLTVHCRMSVHLCLGEFDTQRECRGCGSGMPAGLTVHLCARVLEPAETRECPECHTHVGPAHVIAWAVSRP